MGDLVQAYMTFPQQHRAKLHSTNLIERRCERTSSCARRCSTRLRHGAAWAH